MKHTLLLFSFLILCTGYAFGQIAFEPGYIIDNNGSRTEVLIKNLEWKNNPTALTYKTSARGEEQEATIDDITEFGVGENTVYRRYDVEIDRSSSVLSNLSDSRAAEFTEERLLLHVLVGDGEATLYGYERGGLERFFYQVGNSVVKQLIYKPFKTSDGRVSYNNRFRQQLLLDMACDNISADRVKELRYNEGPLTRLFVTYNTCKDPGYSNTYATKKRRLLHLWVRPAIHNSGLSITSGRLPDTDFDRETAIGAGLLVEYVLPFNKAKWRVVVEPAYHTYSTKKEVSEEVVGVDYKVIDMSVGVRHYFFLTDEQKVFANAVVGSALDLGSAIETSGADVEMKTGAYVALGGGFSHGRFSGELRYAFSHNVLTNYVYWNSDYNTLSLILGYRLF
ncbi:hypothetical protein AB9P05_10980 [Roseivirga sp. BDSF3-8]|uniref:hypothetical protein n=1 Tax=Roseivirga sp. BDSF3-8 TaxID=3241598 RepID=UPI003531A66F